MTNLKLALLLTLVTGCAGSNRLPESAYEARDSVDAAGAKAHANIRPTVRPVVATVDRGVERAVAKAGLRDEKVKN
jgi:hypothetical protein